uniref:Reverse transcriptase domain-containing protein n=1 Tax=Tanacetum cinerariifolium TaxID=118510 RepID=A0A6L2K2K0_TANCI|nr:reverse transcriptase domain-containing protein [Tanacetum cinerariifolium]
MADQRTLAELLRAPTEEYAEAIVVPPTLANQFKLKHSLINMMTTDQFFGLEKDNPHDHIWAARRWLEKEPPRSIHTWEDLVSKFINEFFPSSRTTNLCNEISNFQQRQSRFFECCWGGNLLERRTQDVLMIIKNKSKVRNSRNKYVVSQVKSCDANSNSSSEIAKLTHAVNQQTSDVTTVITAILKQFQPTPPPASVKGVEETYITCGGAHPYYQCLAAGEQSYQASTQQNQIVPLNEFQKVKRMNEANMKAMQTQINILKNELRNEMKNSIQASLSNQTNEIKNMMARLFQMNTASTSWLGSLPSNTIANPKGELKAITTRSGIVLDEPTIPTPPTMINPEEDERKYKPPSQRDFILHPRDPFHPNIPYPSRMLKQKQQEKDKVQIHKFWKIFKQLHINVTLTDALILMPKYQKMLKALLSNKEKLQELANTPLNENCSVVILKKLPEKLEDPGKFQISCGFSELKCKALADLGASINLMPLSVWKKLGLPELISTRMTLELANRAICTPAEIARDVFVLVGKFPFLSDFVIVDYESDPRVLLIFRRPFLRIAHALIGVHGEEMIFRDGDERLNLNMRHDTSSYYNQPQKESINLINVFNNSSEDFFEDFFSNQPSGNPTFSSHPELTSPKVQNDIFDSDIDSSLKDSIDQSNLANLADNFVDFMTEMFIDEHVLDYSSPLIFDEYDDDFLEVESDTENVDEDPFNSKGEKIKESELLIDELNLPCDFLPFEYDSFISQDFSRVNAKPSTNNEDKVFNPGNLIQEKPFEIITRVVQDMKLATYNASLVLEDFDPPFYEPLFLKEVLRSNMLLPFSSENKEKVFKPGIHTFEKVHSSFIPELSHQGYKIFKINQIFKSLMKIFLFSYG